MTAKYSEYDSFKDETSEWYPKTPSHWDLKRGKYLFKEVNERSHDGTEELLSVSEYFGVKPRKNNIDDGEHLSRAESLEGYKKCRPSDLVMNIMLAWKTGLGVSQYEGIVSPAYSVFRFNQECHPPFYHYLLRSPLSVSMFKTRSTGVIDSRLRLYPENFGSLQLLHPPLEEQQAIANFLDHETAKIDNLIAKQERLIELLKEKRQAVISHAVTKGLNPDVPMKDSGVEWLGEVPEHWEVKQYRHSTKIYRGKFGHRPRNDPSLYDGDYPFIQTGDVAQADKFIFDYKQTLNEKGAAVSARFPKGTLVMAIAANIGDTAILTFDAHCPDSIVGFRPSFSVSVEFLRYSLIASIQALQATATQSTQANLNIDRISAVKAVFPPQEEQVKIIGMLDSLLARYDVINEKAVEMISLMKERRAALISSAVTGKIDVRNWQPDTH